MSILVKKTAAQGYLLRKLALLFLVFVLFLTSACNLPVRSSPRSPAPTATPFLPVSIIRETPTPGPQPPTVQPATSATSPMQAPSAQPAASAAPPLEYDPTQYVAYQAQPGDTLNAVAARFGTTPGEILSSQPLPSQGLLPINQTLVIPKPAEQAPFPRYLLPDSEIVNSPCGRSFNSQDFINKARGKLSSYSQVVDSRALSGAEIVRLVSENSSVNPRFLLAFIEYRSHWVTGGLGTPDLAYPLGLNIPNNEGLYLELSLASNLLNIGYYAWREGTMTELVFLDYNSARISPELNAGSVAVQYLFARMFRRPIWENELYGANGFLSTFQKMFGDAAACARSGDPLFPDGMQMPTLELPFIPGEAWALTGGLHSDWITGTPRGAMDFAPITGEKPCEVSRAWVLASAAGIVTLSENGIVQLALVDDAGKTTGWELLYMHVASKERIALGTIVRTDERIGHPSCEGGAASGTHVHFARMYHGEWIGAGDPFPYVLSGWLAVPGEKPFQSTLVKGDQVVESNINGSGKAVIIR